jgi:hypothetical protein
LGEVALDRGPGERGAAAERGAFAGDERAALGEAHEGGVDVFRADRGDLHLAERVGPEREPGEARLIEFTQGRVGLDPPP